MFWKKWFGTKASGSEMSWNEPGNGKGKDPWGGGDNQGPPDLDEAFKKLQDNLSKMFGGKGSGGNGGSGSGGDINPTFIAGIIGAVLLGIFIWSSVYQVQQAETAVVLRTGKFHSLEDAGLNIKIPIIDEVYKVNVQAVRSKRLEAEMLTSDINIVDITLVVQYQVADPKLYLLKVARAEEALLHATESALRHVVGSMKLDAVIAEQRELVASEVKTLLQTSLDRFQTGILISEVSMEEAVAPQAVRAAFDDVNKAKEEEKRLKNEAEAYANGIIPVARGLAKRQLEEAEAYKQSTIARAEGEADRFTKLYKEYRRAPEVTRKRMYIDAMEEVMTNTSKVLVDVEGGNNLLYLPLDKLMMQSSSAKEGSAAKRATEELMKEAQTTPKNISGAERLRQLRDQRREIR
jgi:membrane protease subunit HflK